MVVGNNSMWVSFPYLHVTQIKCMKMFRKGLKSQNATYVYNKCQHNHTIKIDLRSKYKLFIVLWITLSQINKWQKTQQYNQNRNENIWKKIIAWVTSSLQQHTEHTNSHFFYIFIIYETYHWKFRHHNFMFACLNFQCCGDYFASLLSYTKKKMKKKKIFFT